MSTEEHKQWHRLPSNVIPAHYELSITPDMVKFTFQGHVDITIDVKENTNTILLNSVELRLTNVKITQDSTSQEATVSYQVKDETATFTVDNALKAGSQAIVSVDYTGILNDKMAGFYRCNYTDLATGEKRIVATTQFEATDARKALPCWDEPALKATFTVHLTVEKGLVAISNMPVVKEVESKEHSNLITYSYDKTPIMSTYLLAFVVGDLDIIQDKTADGLLVRCLAVKGKGEQARFALEVALRVLPFYNKWFGVDYPLPKYDMVAVPDLAAGAMENWGCVTYRETALLVDPINTSANTKQWVAIVIAHETAHQWFGNIVTMEWWTHLWLNEGFASWMEYYAIDNLFPEWKVWDQFVSSDFNTALSLDALKNSHPIEVEVNHPDEVDEIFDIISYNKGSVVVRMLETWLGAELFQKSISTYITKFQYKNALSSDLWATLQEVSGFNVVEMMAGWTKHVGFPVIMINEEKSHEDQHTIEYNVSQYRFMVNGINKDDESLWYCPISFLTNAHKGVLSKQTLKTRNGTLTLQLPAETNTAAWVKVNAYQTGFYRVLYPASMLKKLQFAIANGDSNLTGADRLGIQSDAFAFTRAGLLDVKLLLDLADCYSNETEFSVWADLASNLIDLAVILKDNDKVYNLYSKWVCSLFSKILNTVGWEKKPGETHQETLLRTKILNTVGCKFADVETNSEAVRRFVEYFTAIASKDEAGESVLSADIRGSTYYMSVQSGGLLGYETTLQLLKYTTLQEERVRLINSLSAASDPMLIIRTLHYSLSSDVRKQDAPSLISAVGNNRHSLALVWQFLQDNWSTVVDKFGGTFGMSRIVDVLGNFTQLDRADEIEKFFSNHSVPAGERAVKQALENIKSNAAWLARDSKAIEEWLVKRVGN